MSQSLGMGGGGCFVLCQMRFLGNLVSPDRLLTGDGFSVLFGPIAGPKSRQKRRWASPHVANDPPAAPAARVGFPGIRSGSITRDSGKVEAVSKCRSAAWSRARRR